MPGTRDVCRGRSNTGREGNYRSGLGVGLFHGDARETSDHRGGHIETNDCLQGKIQIASHRHAEKGARAEDARGTIRGGGGWG